jgi:uncharacterized membrane protein YbhN (UPF0104 family)
MKLWPKLLVTALFLAAILRKVEWGKLWMEARALDAGTWLGVFALIVMVHTVGVFKWRMNVNLGRARLGPLDGAQCYSAGMFANLCLPSIVGGDALKAILAGKITGRFEAAVFGGLNDRLIDAASLVLLVLVGGVLSRGAVPGWAGQALLVGLLVGVGAGVVFLPFLLRIGPKRWPRTFRRPVGRAMVAMRRLVRRPVEALTIFTLSILMQVVLVLLNAWLGRGIGIDVPLGFWFLAVPLTKAITLVPISVGGFGLREAALSTILAAAAVPGEKAVAVSLIWQSMVVSIGLLGGATWFVLGFRPQARTGARHASLAEEVRRRGLHHA